MLLTDIHPTKFLWKNGFLRNSYVIFHSTLICTSMPTRLTIFLLKTAAKWSIIVKTQNGLFRVDTSMFFCIEKSTLFSRIIFDVIWLMYMTGRFIKMALNLTGCNFKTREWNCLKFGTISDQHALDNLRICFYNPLTCSENIN